MKVIKFEVGEMKNLTYFIEYDKSLVIVDPSFGYDRIVEQSKERKISAFLLTHGHYDHLMDAEKLIKRFPDTPFYMNGEDEFLLPFTNFSYNNIGEKDSIDIDGLEVKVIKTPGHSPGSVCYLAEGHLFTGDTLFFDCCGRVDLPGSDPEKMRQSLLKILQLPKDTVIHPGHDYGGAEFTLETAKKKNPYLISASDRDSFLSIIL